MVMKKIKLPLEMADGVAVRTLEELKDNWDLEKVLNHTRVRVTFNKRSLLGFVDKVEEFDGQLEELNAKLGYEVRYIEEVVDEEVIITNEQYGLAKWLKKVTLAPFIQCLNTILPKALKTAKEKVSHKEEKFNLSGVKSFFFMICVGSSMPISASHRSPILFFPEDRL